MLCLVEEELKRAGGFDRIYPAPNVEKDYFKFFSSGVLRSNFLLASWERQKALKTPINLL